MLGAHDVPGVGREPVRAGTAQSAGASAVHQTRAGGHRTEPDLVVGHHQAAGAEEVDLLLPLRVARYLQPLRGGLDGRRPRELGARRAPHRGELSQAGRRARGAHPALRPRRADDQQVHRAVARRPRGHALARPPARLRRQPLLRGAVQDPEVPSGLPRAFPRHRPGDRPLPLVLPSVQHRASPWGDRHAHPGRCPSWPSPRRTGTT